MPKRKSDPFLIDDDNPEWTKEDFRKARPAREVMPPAFFEGMTKLGEERRRQLAAEGRKPLGRPPVEKPKVAFGLRLDPDVVAGIRATGPGYNGRVEKVLRDALAKGRL
jgi:uncharacterized protein (DUF4415 family)